MFERRQPRTFRTKPCRSVQLEQLNSSQGKVGGFDLETYQGSHVVQVGGGGIGSHTANALVRKGIGWLTILDDDQVELPNLTRQLFSKGDIGKNKSLALGRRLEREGFFSTTIHAMPYRFREWAETGHSEEKIDAIICGVDNNPTRVDVSRFGIQHGIPVIHAAVSRDGNSLYCMVQEPGEACFGCMFPHALDDEEYPCNLPGIIDVLQMVAGLIVFSLDSVLCGRSRAWNVRRIFLDGTFSDRTERIERKIECPLCGKREGP